MGKLSSQIVYGILILHVFLHFRTSTLVLVSYANLIATNDPMNYSCDVMRNQRILEVNSLNGEVIL